MHIHVGPFRYRVRLVHGHIEHEGEPCFGLCDNVRQEIRISDVLPERQRLQVFFHELMHAWWYHFDVDPTDQEAVVDLVGVAMTDFVTQALRQLEPEQPLADAEPADPTPLQRALAPTTALEDAQPTSRPKRVPPTAQRSDPRDAPAAQHAGTIEHNGWRMHLYEPVEDGGS